MSNTQKIVTNMDVETLVELSNKLRSELAKVRDILTGQDFLKDGDFLKKCFEAKKLSLKQSKKFAHCINRMLITAVKVGIDAHEALILHDEKAREFETTIPESYLN